MRALLALAAAAALASAEPAPAQLERDLRAYLVAEHTKLAEKCVQDDLVEEARAEYAAVLREDPHNGIAARMTSAGRPWILHWDQPLQDKYLDYRELRRILAYETSSRLLALGLAKKNARDKGGAGLAFRRALEEDPDFADAHKELGEIFVEGQGWFPKAEGEKRAEGLLPFEGKWLPAAEVAEKRRRWENGWEVAGKHFTVRSNHSLDAARQVLGWAEDMYAVLVRETGPVLAPPPDLKPMAVFLFATKDDFDAHVRKFHPGGVSPGVVGFYSNEDLASHFWFREEKDAAPLSTVVHHECLHQALDAWISWKNDPTLNPHFWVYEGLARWFESVENREGKLLAGNPRHGPFQVARAMVEKGTALKLESLVQLSQKEMSAHYEEAAGATLFFMTAGDGKYREKFLRYCATVLAGDAERDTFEKAFGEAPEEFETAWREYLRGLK